MDIDPKITAQDIQSRIRERAYELWQRDGRPHGRHDQHWLAAEKDVLEEVDRSGATGAGLAKPAAQPPRPSGDLDRRQDELLDEAVEETFPASDPISPKRIT